MAMTPNPKKKKNDTIYQRWSLPVFLTLSIVLHGLAAVLAPFISTAVIRALGIEGITTMTALIQGLPQLFIFGMQALLLKYQFDWSGWRWFIASLVGWIGVVATAQLLILWGDNIATSGFQILVIALSLASTFFISGMQNIALRKYVSRASLWIIAMYFVTIVNGFASTFFMSLMPNRLPFWFREGILTPASSGIVMGIVFALTLTLLVNLTQLNATTKAKHSETLAEDSHTRLQDGVNSHAQEMVQEDNAVQKQLSS